jgi:biotin transport system substrate-specific component
MSKNNKTIRKKETFTTKKMVTIALMVAVIAVISPLAIPMPSGVPITLQTFVIALAGTFLYAKWGTISVGIYILIGAIGLPVFSSYGSGLGKLFGMTGGFIWGFLFLAFFCGIQIKTKKKWLTFLLRFVLGLVGLALCHLLGILWFTYVTEGSFVASALLVSLPYLVKDIISVFAGIMIGDILRKRIPME